MDQTPLLTFELFADRHLKPDAVGLRATGGDLDALIPLLLATDFKEFGRSLPCFFDFADAPEASPALLTALHEAGITRLAEKSVHRTDTPARPVLPLAAEWLAGDWSVAQPVRTSGQTVSRALSLKLLQKVAEDADTCEIEAIFRQEPVLAYHLLRLVNSLGVGVGRTISSFSQAILILGRQQLKRWLNLMLFAANRDDHRSAMLLARVAVRARCMELLAKAAGLDRAAQEAAFMGGLFSLLGCLFGMPLAEVLKPLQLSSALNDGLLHRDGELGLLLDIVEQAERGEDSDIAAGLSRLGLTIPDCNGVLLEAHRWMLDVVHDQEAAHV